MEGQIEYLLMDQSSTSLQQSISTYFFTAK